MVEHDFKADLADLKERLERIGRRLIEQNKDHHGEAPMAACIVGETILQELGAKMPEGW